MSAALQSWKIRGLELANRIVVPPMCTWLADPMTNEPNDRHLVHYGGLAMGGAGLIIFEASPVDYRGRLQPDDMGVYSDACIAPLKRINDYIHENSQAKTAIQIGHGGRKATCVNCMVPNPLHLSADDEFGAECIAPSAIPYDEHYHAPREMTREDMDEVKKMFVLAAQRCVKAGFDAIEIHSAHGYLLSSFTSPLTNTRTDEYGGSLENRLKYPVEVCKAVRYAIPATMPLIVRFSASEWMQGGFDVDDGVVYARKLKEIGVDVVHVSSGGNNPKQQFPATPQFQIPLAEKIKKEADIPVIAVGMITELVDAAAIIEDGKADLVGIGRAMLKDPYWLRNQAAELKLDAWFPMYQVAATMSLRKLFKGKDIPKEITQDAVHAVVAGKATDVN